MKGTVPKRLDISYYFGTFYTILNFYFRIVVPTATQHPKFLTSFMQIIVNITVLQLFISRMPKMCAIPQLVSAPLNPIPTVEHFRRSHPQCEHSYGQHIYTSEENNAK